MPKVTITVSDREDTPGAVRVTTEFDPPTPANFAAFSPAQMLTNDILGFIHSTQEVNRVSTIDTDGAERVTLDRPHDPIPKVLQSGGNA